MNRTEQKERLKDIIDAANETILSLDKMRGWLDQALHQIDQLNDHLQTIGEIDGWDEEELKTNVLTTFFENELNEVYEMSMDFQSDLEEYCDEISERRAETLREKYEPLEAIIEMFSIEIQMYDDIDSASESLHEAVEELAFLRK